MSHSLIRDGRSVVLVAEDIAPDDVDLGAGHELLTHAGEQAIDPDVLARTVFFVPSYLGSPAGLAVMGEMPRLRVCQVLTAGVDAVLPFVPPEVLLCNARGVHDASTAELAVALILARLRNIDGFARDALTGVWQPQRHDALADKTVLIVGYGSIGRALESRLLPFECDVIGVASAARAITGPDDTPRAVHGVDELPGLLPTADVVVILVPLSGQTRHLVDAGFLAAMRDGALLVNVSRGPVVDTDALVAELSTGRLRAALDVTDPEPLPPGHPLWRAPGVLISPHVGGNTSAFLPRARRLVRQQIRRFVVGEPLAHVVAGSR